MTHKGHTRMVICRLGVTWGQIFILDKSLTRPSNFYFSDKSFSIFSLNLFLEMLTAL